MKPNYRSTIALNKQIRERIAEIEAEIHRLDLWFISHPSHTDWTEKINRYWVLTARAGDLREKLRYMSSPGAAIKTAILPNNINIKLL